MSSVTYHCDFYYAFADKVKCNVPIENFHENFFSVNSIITINKSHYMRTPVIIGPGFFDNEFGQIRNSGLEKDELSCQVF